MRSTLFLTSTLSLGCTADRVVSIESVPAYVRGETVLTVEGYPLRWADGGKLAPAPHEGRCLTEVGQGEVSLRGKRRQVDVLRDEAGRSCSRHAVRAPEAVLTDGETLTILGDRDGVQVTTSGVRGVEVIGADNGSAPWAPTTRMNSAPVLVAGSVIAGLGVTGMVASMVARSQHRSSGFMDFSGFGYLIGTILSAHVAAAGIPMIAVGAAPVRAPDSDVERERAQSPARPTFELGAGSASLLVEF